jgi:ATP adenylyltransferase
VEGCFFCEPAKDRILHVSEHFYVLLGLGPIVEGYVILVAREHIRSMFDLPAEMKEAYKEEKRSLKQIINNAYGPSIVTEHGRIQACTTEDEEAHDLMCYHAHQLFFPIPVELGDLSKEGPFEKVFEGSGLFQMSSSKLEDKDEYLLYENSRGNTCIYKVRGKCPRQYLRYLVARSVGHPELASWQHYPGEHLIDKARKKYEGHFPQSNIENFPTHQLEGAMHEFSTYCQV